MHFSGILLSHELRHKRLQLSLLGLLDRGDILRRGSLQQGVTAMARVPLRPHEDPSYVVGEMLDMWTLPNGLQVGRKRVPLGVIAAIHHNKLIDQQNKLLEDQNTYLLGLNEKLKELDKSDPALGGGKRSSAEKKGNVINSIDAAFDAIPTTDGRS